ncbi:hypothetical protein [Aureimonas sp. SK2]|uniref:hypothetical protein n=1 Tax=Aureimonas sp. SK2 TaxID=3015992 RepID=UPI00244504A9|nr:hypothetical protein [Aureimonas sp. SK2]
MFISTLFTLALSVCPTPTPGGPPPACTTLAVSGFASAAACEAAAQPIATALRPAGGGQAVGSCHPVAAPREA